VNKMKAFLFAFIFVMYLKNANTKRNLLFLFYLRQRSHSSSTIGLIKSIYVSSCADSSSFLYLVDYGGSNLLPQLEVCDLTTGESFKLPSRQHLYISFFHFFGPTCELHHLFLTQSAMEVQK